MGEILPAKIILLGDPRTKKNSQRVVRMGKFTKILPSKAFEEYETSCLMQISGKYQTISTKVNVKCLFYMQTRRKVDLVNLEEAVSDILVEAFVLEDDNCNVIAGYDGSRVRYDKENPRVEIEITEAEDD